MHDMYSLVTLLQCKFHSALLLCPCYRYCWWAEPARHRSRSLDHLKGTPLEITSTQLQGDTDVPPVIHHTTYMAGCCVWYHWPVIGRCVIEVCAQVAPHDVTFSELPMSNIFSTTLPIPSMVMVSYHIMMVLLRRNAGDWESCQVLIWYERCWMHAGVASQLVLVTPESVNLLLGGTMVPGPGPDLAESLAVFTSRSAAGALLCASECGCSPTSEVHTV